MNLRAEAKSLLLMLLVYLSALPSLGGCNGREMTPFALHGVRLLDETTQVLNVLGPPTEVVPMDYWTSWRYPEIGLTLDLAHIHESPSRERVVWALCSQGDLGGGLKVGSSSDAFARRFPGVIDVGDQRFPVLRQVNSDGHRLDAVISDQGAIEAFILSLPDEVLAVKAEAGAGAEVFSVGGVRLLLSSEEVRSLLGDPDAVSDDFTGHTLAWAYWERGLIVLFSRYDSEYIVYCAVLTRGGHALGIHIGSSVEVVSGLLGPPEWTEEDTRAWSVYDPLDNYLQVIAVGKWVVSISLNLDAEP